MEKRVALVVGWWSWSPVAVANEESFNSALVYHASCRSRKIRLAFVGLRVAKSSGYHESPRRVYGR